MPKQGLFVGLATLDLFYLVEQPPGQNQKVVAMEQAIAAGGPATNAAITFQHLGNQAKLVTTLGQHLLAALMRADLARYQVTAIDLDLTTCIAPAVSSTMVTQATGERAVVSLNAKKQQAKAENISKAIVEAIEIVLIDGHQIAVSERIAQLAQSCQIPVVLDGGSWKPGLENILPFVNYAICSANFYPPGCNDTSSVFDYLKSLGIAQIAVTNGANPIQYLKDGEINELEVPQVKVIDTLGAGDIFHGAFCDAILRQSFVSALAAAAEVAAFSCQFLGTRQWMEQRSLD